MSKKKKKKNDLVQPLAPDMKKVFQEFKESVKHSLVGPANRHKKDKESNGE